VNSTLRKTESVNFAALRSRGIGRNGFAPVVVSSKALKYLEPSTLEKMGMCTSKLTGIQKPVTVTFLSIALSWSGSLEGNCETLKPSTIRTGTKQTIDLIISNCLPVKASTASTIKSIEEKGKWVAATLTAYCKCKKCCGPQAAGITASGKRFKPGILAADPSIPFGTLLQVDGVWREVLDRGGAIRGNRLDLAVASHREAKRRGVREIRVFLP